MNEARRPVRLRARGTRVLAMAVLLGTGLAVGLTRDHATAASPPVEIKVLSNRADLISGGDALVQVNLPRKSAWRRSRSTSTAVTSPRLSP